jgi:hypothetical protein
MQQISPVTSCPGEVRDVADEFQDCVGQHYTAWVAMLCGTMMGISGFSNIVRNLLFSPAVSSLSRFYQETGISQKLNRRHRRRLLRLLPKVLSNPGRYLWVIDDTLIEHEGDNIWGCYWWWDHGKEAYIWGHKLLMVGLVDRKRRVMIPVIWQVLHQEKSEIEMHRKGWEVALDLLDEAVDFGFPKLTVVTDSWFAGEEFFQALLERNLDFVVEIRNNRIVTAYAHQTNLDENVKEFFSDRPRRKIFYLNRPKWSAEAILTFRDAKNRLKTIAVANKKGLAKEPFGYYVSNRLTWDASRIWALARDRWAIEVQFRELKQLFALGEAAVRSKESVETAISVAAIALTVIRLEQLHRVDANENQHVQPVPAGNIVNEIRLKALKQTILTLVNDTDKLAKFSLRMREENFGQKPTEKVPKVKITQKLLKTTRIRKMAS